MCFPISTATLLTIKTFLSFMTFPSSLRRWFVIHFVLDVLFGLPLLFFPQLILGLFGFSAVESVTARLVGAALLAIGGISLLARKEGKEVYGTLLKMKLLWSGSAMVGLLLSLVEGAPRSVWLFLGIFVFFFLLWGYYLREISV